MMGKAWGSSPILSASFHGNYSNNKTNYIT